MEGEENKALTFGNVINTRFTRGNIVSRLVTTAPLNFGEVDPEGMNKDTIHEIIEKHINHLVSPLILCWEYLVPSSTKYIKMMFTL